MTSVDIVGEGDESDPLPVSFLGEEKAGTVVEIGRGHASLGTWTPFCFLPSCSLISEWNSHRNNRQSIRGKTS